ncbi:MAG: (2Fe-2S)-binding protein [Lachnospiraceae bacterium]|jgi:bacterioferritin-associated ferredoxin|nr:(2Fe-2S)-binding protein [Lachnospiraceae bacterium]
MEESCLNKEKIVCRCEEITEEEIMAAIRGGADTLDAVKKSTRSCMGFCQGRTCKRLIASMLSSYFKRPIEDFLPGSLRLPITPIRLSILADTAISSDFGNEDAHA